MLCGQIAWPYQLNKRLEVSSLIGANHHFADVAYELFSGAVVAGVVVVDVFAVDGERNAVCGVIRCFRLR